MIDCKETRERLDALIDGRLNAAEAAEVQAHAGNCAKCGKALEILTMTKTSLRDPRLYHPAPEALRQKMEALALAAPPVRRSRPWIPIAAAVAASVLITWAVLRTRTPSYEMASVDFAVSSHLRSTMTPAHLLDIESSDVNTVKPWFTDKLKFNPPVIDLADKHFQLAGARLDYIGDDPAAAIVYRNDAHTINLFCWPSDEEEGREKANDALISVARSGCNVVYWTHKEMTWCAVSDLGGVELKNFAQLLRERAKN
jgi:anti-sigma factor RsiW